MRFFRVNFIRRFYPIITLDFLHEIILLLNGLIRLNIQMKIKIYRDKIINLCAINLTDKIIINKKI